MFQPIGEYMRQSREARRAHLKLDDVCQEIGGASSKEYRGLLAHHLRTTIPSGRFIMLCHACNNSRCSNPNHLYWGTAQDNVIDQQEHGTHSSIKQRAILKYGEDEYRKMVSAATKKARAVSLQVRMLDDEELEKIKSTIQSVPVGRGRIKKISEALDVSHTHVRRYMKRLGIE